MSCEESTYDIQMRSVVPKTSPRNIDKPQPVPGKTTPEEKLSVARDDQSRDERHVAIAPDIKSSNKPIVPPERGQACKPSKETTKPKNEQGTGSKFSEDHIRNSGDKQELKGSGYNPIRSFFSRLMGMSFLGQRRAVVDTKKPSDLEKVETKNKVTSSSRGEKLEKELPKEDINDEMRLQCGLSSKSTTEQSSDHDEEIDKIITEPAEDVAHDNMCTCRNNDPKPNFGGTNEPSNDTRTEWKTGIQRASYAIKPTIRTSPPQENETFPKLMSREEPTHDIQMERVVPKRPPRNIDKPQPVPEIFSVARYDESRSERHVATATDKESGNKTIIQPELPRMGGHACEQFKETTKPKNKQRAWSKFNDGQMENFGEKREPNSSYDTKLILVSGLNEKTTVDALSNYMELMSGEDVVGVTFLEQGRAVVDTEEPLDFEKVKSKVSKRKLDGMQPKVEMIEVCDSILVSGLSPKVTKDTILLYFENVRRSGGGDVKGEVTLNKDMNCAVVCFENPKVIDIVINKVHSLEGQEIIVAKCYPQISPEIQSSSVIAPSPSNPTETEKAAITKEKSEPPPDRPNVDTEVDRDIMQFIMIGRHRKDLDEKLNDCKAEIEWVPGSKSAKIWKKLDSGYVKKWSTACQTITCEFLDQFEKFSMPCASILAPVIKDALPRLTKDIAKGRALCQVNDDKNEITLVCLENDKDIVLDAVEKVLEIIEKEEIRKTYRKETVKISNHEHLLLLEKMKFVEEMKDKHPDLEVNLCKEKQELYFEGPREEFRNFKIGYFQLMNSITERKFSLPFAKLGDIVAQKPGGKYLEAKLDREKINAMMFVEQDNIVKIVAANSTDWQKAQACILDSMKSDKVMFQAQDFFIFESKKCRELFKDLQKDQLIDISTDKQGDSIALQGMVEAVENAKKKLEDFIERECVRDKSRSCLKGCLRLLDDHYSEELRRVESNLNVSMKVNITNEVIEMTGTREGLQKCNEFLSDLLSQIVEKTEEYSSPGLAQLFLGHKGERNLELIEDEVERKVIIETSKRVKHGVRDTKQEEVDVIESEEKHSMKYREDVAQSSLGSQKTGCIYDDCNFTTATEIRVSWKYGHIENEVADVLVNSATTNLNNLTACGKALAAVGGRKFIKACKPHTNIADGDIISTQSGQLPCNFVIHVVCCNWDNGKTGPEQLLRNLVNKILSECVRLKMTSVAIPTIGTGQHRFPEAVVFQVYKEEIQRFSATGSPNSLKEIRIIVFKAGQTSNIPTTTGAGNPRIVSFGRVRVLLHEGDITQQLTAVDAIINSLDSSLNLASGGGVNKVILNAGGQVIQQELNAVGKKPPGSVIPTRAGNIQNAQRILHFLPTSTDVQGLQSSIEGCLQQAKALGLASVSVPAIGTAVFSINPSDSANLIVNAAKSFSAKNYKLDVNIVVFQKSMIADFEKVFVKHAPAPVSAPPTQQQNVPNVRKKTRSLFRSSSQKVIKTGSAKEVIVLQIFASLQQDIDTAFKEVDKFIKEHTTTKRIEQEMAFDVLVKNWPEVESLARDHDVSISCNNSSSVVDIKGLVANVSDCEEKLFSLIALHVEEE